MRRASRHVEVTGVADDDHVEVDLRSSQQAHLRAREPAADRRPNENLCSRSSQTGHVTLDHLDARIAEARDHLRVSRVVALVRPEVENSHVRG